MGRWTATTTVNADPNGVLAALTDPDEIRRWSPVQFDLPGRARRLEAGTRQSVRGQIAGIGTCYDVEVLAADERRLKLRADGPVPLDVEYAIAHDGVNAAIRAEVVVSPGAGLRGRVMSRAVDGLLAAGALDVALSRLASLYETA